MLQSSAFDYINVLDKAADASWLRESVLANNIANATTPDFKRYDVNFQSLLEREMMDSKFNRNLDEKVHNVNLRRLTATSQIDLAAESFSYRLDDNNVDIHLKHMTNPPLRGTRACRVRMRMGKTVIICSRTMNVPNRISQILPENIW